MSNSQIIKDFQQAMQLSDHDSAFKLIANDAVWHSDPIGAPWSGTHHGIQNIKNHFDAIKGTTKNFTRRIHRLIEDDDLVIEIGSLSCTLIKTGNLFETEYVCLYQVKLGKIISYRILEDSLKLYNAYFPSEASTKEKQDYLSFDHVVAQIQPGEMAKVIKKEEIDQHFPAPSPGAIKLFEDKLAQVGMVRTEHHDSFPHRNKVDEVHYVIKGQAKFRHGNAPAVAVSAGDVVYVKAPEEHEWLDCSPDLELIFIQCGTQ